MGVLGVARRPAVAASVGLAAADGSMLRLFRDGVEVASAPIAGELAISALPFRIGRKEGGGVGSNCWRGSIDELSVYDRPLTADEIAAIHGAGGDGKCSG